MHNPNTPPCVATIGFFDGVHRGHRYLIDYVRQLAKTNGIPSMVVTFGTHPRQVVQQGFTPQLLSTPEEKLKLLRQTGTCHNMVLNFDENMAALTAREFMQRILKERLNVAQLVIGYDNKFGHNREEGFEDYQRYGKQMGINVTEAPQFAPNGEHISSSAIRSHLQEGRIAQANALLGYDYSIAGQVVPGFQEGRKMGFPTANLLVDNAQKLLPQNGVYATLVELDGFEQPLMGMTNIGNRPTFNGKGITIETNILDFSADIYGQNMRVSFVERIRPEVRFNSIDELKTKMKADEQSARSMLADVAKR